MIFSTCLVSIAAVALLSRRVHRTVLSPWAIYTIVWLGLIGVHSLEWVHFIPISARTWFMLLGSLASYLAGAGLLFAVKPTGVAMSLPAKERWFAGVNFVGVRQFHVVITIMGLVGSVGYFLVVQRLYGLGCPRHRPRDDSQRTKHSRVYRHVLLVEVSILHELACDRAWAGLDSGAWAANPFVGLCCSVIEVMVNFRTCVPWTDAPGWFCHGISPDRTAPRYQRFATVVRGGRVGCFRCRILYSGWRTPRQDIGILH